MRPPTKGKSDFVLDNIPVPRISGLLFLPLHSLRSLNFPSLPFIYGRKKKSHRKRGFLEISPFKVPNHRLRGKGLLGENIYTTENRLRSILF